MPFSILDPTIHLLTLGLILMFWAQWRITHTCQQSPQPQAASGKTASRRAQASMNGNGATNVAASGKLDVC